MTEPKREVWVIEVNGFPLEAGMSRDKSNVDEDVDPGNGEEVVRYVPAVEQARAVTAVAGRGGDAEDDGRGYVVTSEHRGIAIGILDGTDFTDGPDDGTEVIARALARAEAYGRERAELAAEAGKAQAEGWVPVGERLPEPETRVLVLGRDGTMSSRYLPQCRQEYWYPGGWHINWTTHWMLLPPPPASQLPAGEEGR